LNEREQSSEDKTEEASDERRKQFREEGNIANPREFMAAVALLVSTLGLSFLGREIHDAFVLSFRRSWTLVTRHTMSPEMVIDAIGAVAQPLVTSLVGLGVVLTVTPVLLGLLFTRFNWSWKKLEFDLNKMNPVSGVQRLFSLQGLGELVKSILKLVILTFVCYFVLKDAIAGSGLAHFKDLPVLLGEMSTDVFTLLMAVSIASFVIGAIDFAWSWFRIEKQMKMTKQEVKDEHKQHEGDPLVKSQRRRMARDFVTRKTLAKVPEATFVVINPTHFSVAIRYVKGMSAPVVVAKGQDFLALRIREIAKEKDIILVENKALARALYKTVKVGQEVPPSLYGSVIEVMKYIYQVKGRDYFQKYALTP
jgi:flagellar biosynthetic protein FlhB